MQLAGAGHLEQTTEHFKPFYESNAAQIGEEGAIGFPSWAAANGCKLPEGLPGEMLMEPEVEEEEDPGGWSGWQELASEIPAEEPAAAEPTESESKVRPRRRASSSHWACVEFYSGRNIHPPAVIAE